MRARASETVPGSAEPALVVPRLPTGMRLPFLSRPDPSWYTGFSVPDPHVTLTYLGTAGFVLANAERTVVLDPYVTRTDLAELAARPLESDEALVRALIPRADDVCVGHAHFDHVLDAPTVCRQTGARLVGSRAVAMVGRAAGLPERQIVETNGRTDVASGPWTIRALPSIHGKAVLGRVPLPGDILAPPPWPPRVRDLRHGQVMNWSIDTGGLRIVHVDSADFLATELRGQRADVVCLCAIGRAYRPRYVDEIVALLRPRWIVPCHWDTMITPYGMPPDLLPGVDLPGFLREIRRAGVEPLLLPIGGKLGLPRVGVTATDRRS